MSEIKPKSNFIRTIITNDLEKEKNNLTVHTRFPPEPNGFLHIGHAKSICLNFGIARDYNGECNLRFDDTNPSKEDTKYVNAIKEDVQWLGFDWEDREYFASDYFDQLYEYAVQLIKSGKAYICDLTPGEVREYRGTLTEPGKNSPYRDRSIEDNLSLFEEMKSGAFDEATHSLRAKIDMSSGNINLRDPTLYRVKHATHHRTGNKWFIYPMYDFAHGLSDSIEGITHSICTLEFEDHRPLYDWILDQLNVHHPQQIEFARLNINYTVLSKRKLLQLVRDGHVNGWDDPRMPTISGLRRRGYTAAAIRNFCDHIGVAKSNSTVDITLLEHFLREDLNKSALRRMVVLKPLKVIIDNYPDNQFEELDIPNNPEDNHTGTRKVTFGKELYIEHDDFMEHPPNKKFFRLSPGQEVRLINAYYITCTSVEKDDAGNIISLHCTYDSTTKGGWSDDGRKVKGTLHWVSAEHAINAQINMYDRLFVSENPEATGDFIDDLNPNSLTVLENCKIEPSLVDATDSDRFQFLRNGYFCKDSSFKSTPIFNQSVSLRSSIKF